MVIVKGLLNLTYLQNTGGAYGIGSSNTVIFVIFNIIIITLLTMYILKNKTSIQLVIGISLIIAGGIGNLIDRVFRGYVIDYIDINPLIKYPVFNIADMCVVIRMYNYCNKYNY